MSESSTKTKSPNLAKLLALAEVLQSVSPDLRREPYIKRRYEDLASDFDVSLGYFKLLGLVDVKNGIINVQKKLNKQINGNSTLNLQRFKELVVSELLSEKTSSEFLDEFLSLFERTDGDMVLNLSLDERLKYSDLRNLFVELNMMTYLPLRDAYRVESVLTSKVQKASERARRRILSEDQLLKQLESQKTLGTNAELLVIEFERQRLSAEPEFVSKIEHIAKIDVGAGYDILSWELGGQEKRCIEVKAVSSDNFKFFWSSNEIEAASKHGKLYYLYLLPVISTDKFDLEALEIIQDPYKNVFLDKKLWSKAEKIYTIWKEQK